eukprot:gb/GEZN01001890.1/.p1 GENE.gb/GEZN01001890.1/~~gb/GEZN01001890.1/.p1  ORF type:complete len:530 (+),score=92.59 gb/GEZN01001890.1/:1012-2601(+)
MGDQEQSQPLPVASQSYSAVAEEELESDTSISALLPAKVRFALYSAHALQSFGDRLWNFAVPILFISIWTETLFPAALFSFVLSGGGFFLMSSVGAWMDAENRLKVMRIGLLGQNSLIVLNCAFLLVIVALEERTSTSIAAKEPVWTWQLILIFSLLLLSALVAQLCSNVVLLALERDWVVSISKPENLKVYNATLRRIDLLCKFCAPVFFGAVVEFVPREQLYSDVKLGSLVVAAWNAVAAVPQYIALAYLYRSFPALHHKEPQALSKAEAVSTPDQGAFFKALAHWRFYFNHPIFMASLGYSCLFLTVLDNGTLMTAYLKWVGVPEVLLGLSRGVGALFGIGGTFMAGCSRGYFPSLESFGVFSVWSFFLMILPAALPYVFRFLGLQLTLLQAGYVMLVAVSLSRAALWAFDLAHTEVMQRVVENQSRGVVNASQTACYQLFWMVLYVLGMIFNRPQEFVILTSVSVGAVFVAALLWTRWARRIKSKAYQEWLDKGKGYEEMGLGERLGMGATLGGTDTEEEADYSA